ncbi:MAG: hypothetical protein JSV66_09495 [Trueperaceae bacterium]|nr:MAG: hypothetical protein JSV66_09495 [Trueperaceae bacterium]
MNERKTNSIIYTIARILLSATAGTGGFLLASYLVARALLSGPNNFLYLTLVGSLVGYLISPPLARKLDSAWKKLLGIVIQVAPETILAAGTGATVALVLTVLLNNVLATVPGFTWYWSLLIAFSLTSASSWFFVSNQDLFRFSRSQTVRSEEQHPDVTTGAGRIIDTSAIIDGRLVDIIEANFLDGLIIIPNFVLIELQKIADSEDPLRRRRGRRGLEMLDKLVQHHTSQTELIQDDPEEVKTVDEKLIKLCQSRGADLITTDYNLNRVAALQGVRVLNVNQLANAIKAMYLPGEHLSLHIVRKGREPGQGLAYLEDGTMVVIEDASEHVGKTVDTIVTSNLQTNMGRMIFAKPALTPLLDSR